MKRKTQQQTAWSPDIRKPLLRVLTMSLVLVVSGLLLGGTASATGKLKGQVLGGGAPIASSTMTLWAASAGEPKQLAQAKTGADGRFALSAAKAPGKDAILYLVAKGGQPTVNKGSGGNPAIALLTVLGSKPLEKVTINEITTIASVWTHNQFIDGATIKGQPLQLKIAAGNVPSFVDLATGGWRLGHDDTGPTQQRTDADDGEFRDVGRRALGLCHARNTGGLQQALRACHAADWHRSGGYADGNPVDRPVSVVPARTPLRAARSVLSGAAGQDDACSALHALSAILA